MADLANRLIDTLKQTLAAGLGLFLGAGTALASPDWTLIDLRAQLAELTAEMSVDGPARNKNVADVVNSIDWPIAKATPSDVPDFVEPVADAQIGWGDLRFALLPLSQAYGAKDIFDIHAVIGDQGNEALVIEKGVVTMAQLRNRLTPRQLGRNVKTGADVLRLPLVINKDAALRLGPEDIVELSRPDGAFIVNFGRLEIFGGEVHSDNSTDETLGEFVPFVATVGTGSAHLSGATMKRLGFGFTPKFSGFSVVAYPGVRPSQRTIIENSRFDELVTVSLVGVVNAQVRHSKFFDMKSNPLFISRSQNTDISGNLISGDTRANAVRVWHSSGGTRLVGNVVLEGFLAGLVVSSGSDNVEVRGNLIWRRGGGGVRLSDVSCAVVEGNIVLDDKQKGIEVRSSSHSLLRGNSLIGNKNAAVWVSGQEPTAVTYVTGNLLRENGSGLMTANGAGVALHRNDFSNQFPRVLDGDVTQQFRTIIADLHGELPILLESGGSTPTDDLIPQSCAS